MFDTRRDSIDTSPCAGQFRPPPRIGNSYQLLKMKPFFFSAGVPVLLTLVMAGCGSSKDDSKAEKSKAEKRADESITQIAQLTPPHVLDRGYVSSPSASRVIRVSMKAGTSHIIAR